MYSSIPRRAGFLALAAGLGLQVGLAQTITPAMAVPAGSVNTGLPGMKFRIVQGNSSTPMTAALPAEGLISGKKIDPTSGLPLNNAVPNPVDGSYLYTIDKYVNWHEQVLANPAVTGGNFSTAAAAPHNIADEAMLGIPGDAGDVASGNYYAMEFTGFLQLPAGTVRFGVNSDDGFKLTVGAGVNAAVPTLQLLILDGTRGFGNTEANITVTQAGIYPFRLLFWDQTGANSGIEFYTFAPGQTSGNRYLVNDPGQANSIKSYREVVGNPPSILAASPALTTYVDPRGNAAAVPPAPYLWVDIRDGAAAVDPSSVTFSLDGTPLAPTIAKNGDVTTVAALTSVLAAGSSHTLTLVYAGVGGNSVTTTWPFTVSSYQTVPAEYALASVDTTKPGFRAKVYQIDINRNPSTGNVPNAERQIAAGYIDPTTGQPYPNTAMTDWLDNLGTVLSTTDAEGFFTVAEQINWNQDAPTAAGNFSASSTPPMEDKTVPGITGNTSANTTDRCVFSIETILELKAGAYRFGVNSDDGFRLSAGRGPGDVVGMQFGTAGDRSAADSFMDFLIAADGFYPFRLMWLETSGGASCEFFAVDLATGTKTLINDAAGFTPIKAYRESPVSRPCISKVLPTVNYGYAFADEDLIIDITDGALSVDPAAFLLTLNGAAVAPTVSKTGQVTTLTRKGGVASLLGSTGNNVSLVYGFSEGGATKTATNNWSFNVPAYTRPIPAGNRVGVGEVSGAGFKVWTHQLDRSLDANQGNGGRYSGQNGGAANMPRPEIQIAKGYINRTNNLPYANLAQPGPNADGSYDVAEVLNFNNAQSSGGPAANAGIFNGDSQVPGLPGTATSNFGLDNTTSEMIAYLELKAGAHIFGINVDDGWLCSSSPNPKDTLGTLLGFRASPGGQNGNPVHNPNAAFNVIVPEDGIYPVRILFWQGGGGVNFEFLAVDRATGSQVLVNDVNGAYPSVVAASGQLISPIKAYSTYTGPARPWTRFSVYPLPTSSTHWQNTHQQSGPGPILVKVGAGNPVDIANDEPRIDQALVNWPFGDAIGAIIADLGNGSVGMVLDDVSVSPTVTSVPNSTDSLAMYVPNPPLAPKSKHTAGLVYAGTTNYWTFTVSDYVTLPAGTAVPADQVDLSAAGFHVKITQAAAARTGGNTAAAAEAQLTGTPANVAIPGPEPDGASIDADVLNWNVTKNPGATVAEIGNFQTLMTGQVDEPVPGIPGTGLSGAPRFENITAEICAYLDLPAGYQKFGVNGDDGWKVQIGKPGETSGTILFSRDRGTGARDIPFAFITPEAGLYPVRLVWYQGAGGGNLEFFTYGPNNSKILVNDRNNPDAVKAYARARSITEPTLSVKLLADGKVQITFEGKLLQSSIISPANWQEVSGATSPYEVAPAGAELYFRATR